MIEDHCWKWPNEWTRKYPDIISIYVPTITPTKNDKVRGKNKKGKIVKFNVRNVLEDLCDDGKQVEWISLAAVVYFIRNERNARLFRGDKRKTDDLGKAISETIKLRLMSINVKNSVTLFQVEQLWGVQFKKLRKQLNSK
ncbi:hypothetical protein Tco_0548286 [Tanacetum coccineum]